MSDADFTRSAVVLGRILDVDPTTVRRWRAAGLPWDDRLGFPIDRCRAWVSARREAAEARRAGGDAGALAELRRHRARLGWHRADRARSRMVSTVWLKEQHAARVEFLRAAFEGMARDLAASVAGVGPSIARLALEARFRSFFEAITTARPESPVPRAEAVAPTLEAEPVVRPGERASDSARRWLVEIHRAEGARIELVLAQERGEQVPLAHVEDVLGQRMLEARTALQALAYSLAPEFLGKTVDEISALLADELREVLAGYSRPLPAPPRPDDTETPNEIDNQNNLNDEEPEP